MPRPLLSPSFAPGIPPALRTPSCSRLPPLQAGATAAPHALGPRVAAQGSAPTRLSCLLLLTTSRTATWSTEGSGTTNTPATTFPDHPRQIPSIVPAAGDPNPSWRSPPRPPKTALPLTCHSSPPAPHRHRLPQPPASCSATTSPSTG